MLVRGDRPDRPDTGEDRQITSLHREAGAEGPAHPTGGDVTDIDQRTLDLIHAEIDGLNSTDESSRLRELLVGDSAARDYFAGMVELSETLAGVGQIDPPEGLRLDIMRSVRAAPLSTPRSIRLPHTT